MKKTKKLNVGGLIALCVFLVLSILAIVFSGKLFGAESIFYEGSANYVFGSLPTSLQTFMQKIPAFIKSIAIITFAIVAYKVVRVASKKIFNKNNKMLTIMSLILSVLKWVITIVAVLMILSAFGVNTTMLFASVGILTLVIGLGAQSLVADIIAGFFIIFEGEYQVGDIITVDGWRGTVKDIGIRVTRLEDVGGNIKTINNSDVRNVINQTNELSIAKVTVPIDYDESLERVEVVLKNSFPEIKEKIPGLIEGPFYKGVSELGESCVELLVTAKCKEENIYQIQRDLRRELYIVFNNNNIGVPFNQIVLSNRNVKRVEASEEVKKEAFKFAKKQSASKDIVEDKW